MPTKHEALFVIKYPGRLVVSAKETHRSERQIPTFPQKLGQVLKTKERLAAVKAILFATENRLAQFKLQFEQFFERHVGPFFN